MGSDGEDGRRFENALREDRSRLATALEIAALGTWDFDPQTELTRGDRRFAEIYGVLPGEALTPAQMYESIHPDDRADARHRIEEAVRSGASYSVEYRLRRSDGSQRWVMVRGTPVAAEGSSGPGVDRFLGTVMDVTEHREQAAKRLEALERERETAALLDSLLDAAPIGIGFWDRDLRFRKLNKRLAEMNGLPARAHLGLRPDELFPGLSELGQVLRQWRKVVETGTPLLDVEIRGRTQAESTEERIWIEDFFPVRLGEEIIGLGAVVEDITERRQAEIALQQSESRYRTLFESIDEGFCVIEMMLDENGRGVDYRYLEVNSAFERHTGLHDAAGRAARELVPGLEDRWPEIFGRVAVTQQPERFVDSSEAIGRWFDVYAFPVGERAQYRVALLFRDITEQKHLEALDRRESELKDRFLATLAHELRNPLAPLQSGLDLLHIEDDDAEARRRVLQMMRRQMVHLVRLVDDLLDLSRITRGKVRLELEDCDLRQILGQAIEAAAATGAEGRRVSLELPRHPVRIRCDPVRLVQIFGNLLSNAHKYTPEEGDISVRVKTEADRVRISVLDEGVGIPKQELGQVFELFHQGVQGSHGGLGIGLTLVRDLLKLHQGTVEAFSEGVGRGSEFVVTLPVTADREFEARRTEDPGDAPAGVGPRRVLVVDDNEDAAESLSMLLGVLGATVKMVHDGASALQAADVFRPHVVLLDIGLPDMSGFEVAGALRSQLGSDTPRLVAVTGWGSEADKARASAAGFDDHLTKPADAESLSSVLGD